MSKIAEVMYSEISRLARKETKKAVAPLLANQRTLRLSVSALSKRVATLQKSLAKQMKIVGASRPQLPAPSPEEVAGTRLSAGLIKKLRKRLKISQADLAALIDVSAPAVASWEQGRAKPRPEKRVAIIGLRSLSPTAVGEMLGEE